MKKIVLAILFLAIIATIGLYAMYTHIGRTGSTDVEQWIGRHLVTVVEYHINPKFSFQSIDYQAPKTVVVDNMALTAENESIMTAQRMLLELAEIPQKGRPIQIQRIELEQPSLRLIHTTDRGYVGWSNFVRPEVKKNLDAVPQGNRLSDVLVLRRVTIDNGQLFYDDNKPDTDPMILPGITISINTAPLPDDPGWYKIAGSCQRAPIFDTNIDGRINLDTALLTLNDLVLRANLDDKKYNTLPPQIQTILRQHQVQGRLNIKIKGQVPLNEPATAQVQIQTSLVNAKAAFGPALIPVDRFTLETSLANKSATNRYELQLLGGRASGLAILNLDMPYHSRFEWNINALKLENALQSIEREKPKYSGLITSSGHLSAQLSNLSSSLSGGGTLQINKGNLMKLPVLSDLVNLMSVIKLGAQKDHNDRLDATFELQRDHIHITDMQFKSPMLAFKGFGRIYYNAQLDLNINADLLLKLSDIKGAVGDILQQIETLGGKTITYKIKGTLKEPKVTVQPLGLGK